MLFWSYNIYLCNWEYCLPIPDIQSYRDLFISSLCWLTDCTTINQSQHLASLDFFLKFFGPLSARRSSSSSSSPLDFLASLDFLEFVGPLSDHLLLVDFLDFLELQESARERWAPPRTSSRRQGAGVAASIVLEGGERVEELLRSFQKKAQWQHKLSIRQGSFVCWSRSFYFGFNYYFNLKRNYCTCRGWNTLIVIDK